MAAKRTTTEQRSALLDIRIALSRLQTEVQNGLDWVYEAGAGDSAYSLDACLDMLVEVSATLVSESNKVQRRSKAIKGGAR